MGGDCGGTLFGEDGKGYRGFGFEGNERSFMRRSGGRGAVRNSTLLRLAKGVGELTRILPVLAVGRVVGQKRIGHMIRFEAYRRVIIDTPLVLELTGPRIRLKKRQG
jgi:hypothetical protein